MNVERPAEQNESVIFPSFIAHCSLLTVGLSFLVFLQKSFEEHQVFFLVAQLRTAAEETELAHTHRALHREIYAGATQSAVTG